MNICNSHPLCSVSFESFECPVCALEHDRNQARASAAAATRRAALLQAENDRRELSRAVWAEVIDKAYTEIEGLRALSNKVNRYPRLRIAEGRPVNSEQEKQKK